MPDGGTEAGRIAKTLETLEERMNKVSQEKRSEFQKNTMTRWDPSGMLKALAANKRKKPGMLSVYDLQQAKQLVKGMVVTPMDKMAGEPVLVCAAQWRKATQDFGDSLQGVGPAEMKDLSVKLGRVAKSFSYVPYSRLTHMSRHRYGSLKMWVKSKTFMNHPAGYPQTWQEVKWRPLLSYARFHWRHALSHVGRFATFAVPYLGWGWGTSDPRVFNQDVFRFSGEQRPRERPRRPLPPRPRVGMCSRDLKDFFVKVQHFDIIEALNQAISEIQERDGSLKYF